MVMSRRAALAGAASLMATPVIGREIGALALKGLVGVLEEMSAIEESGLGCVHILIAPGCWRGGELWRATAAVRGDVGLRWIPCGEGQAEGVRAVAAAIEDGTLSGVRDLLLSAPVPEPGVEALVRARKQDGRYDRDVARRLVDATGRPPAMPSLVFRARGGQERVVRGAVDVAGLLRIRALLVSD